MIAVHASYLAEQGVCLWGEDSALPAAASRRAAPADTSEASEPFPHPFACDPGPLRRALESQAVALGRGTRRTQLTLELPSSGEGPEASPQLLRTVDDGDALPSFDRRDRWRVPALMLPPDALLDLALQLPSGPVGGVAVGDSLRLCAETAKLALELVARGRLRARLERRGGSWVACWRPVAIEPEDAERVELLERLAPAVLVAAGPAEVRGGAVGGLLEALVDAYARRLAAAVPAPEPSSPVEAWLAALTSEDPVVAGDSWELSALAERLDDWWAEAERYAARRMFRTCFRLVPPGESDREAGRSDETDGDGESRDAAAEKPWRVEIMLQSKEDPSVLVPAADVWSHSERLTALGRMLENPQERLLGGLGHALRLWPELEPALREPTPTEVELDLDGAHRFLRDAAPALEQGGFAVLVPPWWRQRMRAKLSANAEAEWGEGSGLFGLDGLCAYEWRVALGEVTLTRAELEALAEIKVPLVRARGRWIALRAADVEAALAFLARREQRGRAPAAEVLREALGLGGAGRAWDELEVELDASGWLGDLLGASGDRKLGRIPTPEGFRGELRPYQERGLAWLGFLSSTGLGACLADDMGLGKTIQLLALLLAEREQRAGSGAPGPAPTLLVCPTSVVGNWEREAERFAPELGVHVHHGPGRLAGRAFAVAAKSSDLVLTTYGIALRDRETLAGVEWEHLVLDEAQNIKSAEAKQTRAIRSLRARHRVAMTGTPVENRLSDLHSIMDFLNPGLLGSPGGFQERFTNPIERYRDGTAAKRLREVTGPFILRRLKTDAAIVDDLPEKIEMRVDCHLTGEQATLYQAVVDEMLEQAAGAAGIERSGIVLAALTKLKQVCNHPAHLLRDRSPLAGRSGKLERLEEIVDEALAEGDRALCFTQFAEFGHDLRAHLQERTGREVLFLHGGTSRRARDEMVKRFQAAGGPPLFVLSVKAGGTGLNLTAANHVIHFDRWWNPAVESQATDRAFRIGQRKAVQVRKLCCVGTLEERIDLLLAEKRDLAESIVGSGEAWLSGLDTARLRELVRLSSDAVAAGAPPAELAEAA